jgi:hypothetical protein
VSRRRRHKSRLPSFAASPQRVAHAQSETLRASRFSAGYRRLAPLQDAFVHIGWRRLACAPGKRTHAALWLCMASGRLATRAGRRDWERLGEKWPRSRPTRRFRYTYACGRGVGDVKAESFARAGFGRDPDIGASARFSGCLSVGSLRSKSRPNSTPRPGASSSTNIGCRSHSESKVTPTCLTSHFSTAWRVRDPVAAP